jgi:hypothetical protein
MFWNSAHCGGIKSLSLPHNPKIINVENENFKTALKRQLNMHSFYLTNFKELHNHCKDFGIYIIQINTITYWL